MCQNQSSPLHTSNCPSPTAGVSWRSRWRLRLPGPPALSSQTPPSGLIVQWPGHLHWFCRNPYTGICCLSKHVGVNNGMRLFSSPVPLCWCLFPQSGQLLRWNHGREVEAFWGVTIFTICMLLTHAPSKSQQKTEMVFILVTTAPALQFLLPLSCPFRFCMI